MANEAQVNSGLSIRVGNLVYMSQPGQFAATVTGSKGPTPGAVSVPTTGVDVSFAELTTLGLCRLMNLDATNYVRYGIHDGAVFHPLGRILPGETYVLRLDPSLGEEEEITGSGTPPATNKMYLKAVGGTCNVLVEAFEN